MTVPSHAVGIDGNESSVVTHGSYAPGEAVYDEDRSNAHPAIPAIRWRFGRQVGISRRQLNILSLVYLGLWTDNDKFSGARHPCMRRGRIPLGNALPTGTTCSSDQAQPES